MISSHACQTVCAIMSGLTCLPNRLDVAHLSRVLCADGESRGAAGHLAGHVTQAVYIFTNMLLKLLREEKPDYIAAIFESREKTFRHETFADYKANRVADA